MVQASLHKYETRKSQGVVVEATSLTKRFGSVTAVDGVGYYCWKYPELTLDYYHDYSSGYSGRIKLSE